jgi:hypothetical protein
LLASYNTSVIRYWDAQAKTLDGFPVVFVPALPVYTTAATINATRQAGGRIIAVGTTSLRLLETAADAAGHLHPYRGETAIFITPGRPIRGADLLWTNFHLPRSTLFMLVCAFAGTERMRAAYAHALTAGQTAQEYEPDGRAAEEMAQLYAWLRSIMPAEAPTNHRAA